MSPNEEERQKRLREGATAALVRAARKARELARQTGTEFVVRRDGKLVREIPKADNQEEPKCFGVY